MCEALRIRILVIACQDIRMLKYEYIKQDTDFFQIIQSVYWRLCKNASEFQGISANEFQT